MALSSLLREEVSMQLDETSSAEAKELGVSFYSLEFCLDQSISERVR